MNRRATFYWFLAFLTLVHLVYAGLLELSLDEAYYWVWGKNPSLSYFDHPPMVAWFIWLTESLGDSERFVRLSAVISASVVTWLVYEMGCMVGGDNRSGFVAALLLNALPLFVMGGFVITPDTPQILFWTASMYAGLRLAETQEPRWWYVVGFFFGLAMLSKYTAAFFAPCLLLFCLLSAENRHWLFRREPYLAFSLSVLLFTPVLWWNYAHGWSSFSFQLAHGLIPEKRDVLSDFGEFWGLQVVSLGLFIFFFLMVAAFGIYRFARSERRDDYLYLFCMGAPIICFFLINSLRTGMEGNWAAVAYIAPVVALPTWLTLAGARMSNRAEYLLHRSFWASLLFGLLFTSLAQAQLAEPFFDMPQKREISRRFYGWQALGREAAARMTDLGSDSFLLTSRYQITSLLAYYTPGRPPSYKTGGMQRFGAFLADETIVGKNGLYVIETERVDLPRIADYFETITPAGTYRIERQGELIREFSFFKCYNYRGGLTNSL